MRLPTKFQPSRWTVAPSGLFFVFQTLNKLCSLGPNSKIIYITPVDMYKGHIIRFSAISNKFEDHL